MANIERSANFFLQICSFTRHLLDDFLPVEVFNKPNISPNIVENVIKECDALIGSLQKFKTQTNVIRVNEAASLLDGLNVKDNAQFNKLCETVIENIVTISDIIKYKPFYCQICNLSTWEENVFYEHCASLKHVEKINQKTESLTVYKCKLCYMVVIAQQSDINSIKFLSNHCKLDEHIKILKENMSITSIEQLSDGSIQSNSLSNATESVNAEMNVTQIAVKCKKNSLQRSTGSNSQNNIVESTGNITKSVMPAKVKHALRLMRKKLRVERHLPDTSLHYCNICDVLVYSTSSYIKHNSSKQHISAVNNAKNPINLFKCEKCKILITGYSSVINEIITSDLHKEIDEWVKPLKKVPAQKQDTAANKTMQSSLNSTTKTNIVSKQSSEEMPIILQRTLSYIYDKAKTLNDLKKYSSSYCFVCERRVDSANNLLQHIKAKQHNVLCSAIAQPLSFYQCTVCLVGLFGTENEISNIIKSREHVNADQKINNNIKNVKINLENSQADGNGSKEKDDAPPVNISNVSSMPEIKPPLQQLLIASTNINSIPTNFLTFNAKLLNGCFSKCGFCRLCNKGIIIKNGWAVHVNCKNHIAKLTESCTNVNLLPSRCKFCPFQVLGDQRFGNACMNYHIKLNHPDGKSIELRNEQDIASDFSGTSVISSQQYVNSNIKITSDNLVLNRIQGTADGNKAAQGSTLEPAIKDSNKSSINENTNITSCDSVSNLNLFIKLLNKKKNIFLEEGLKQFGGICLLCSEVFEDYYVWLIHVKGTFHRDLHQMHIYERECVKCNLSLFGNRSVIDDELWSLEEHSSLDTFVSQ